MLRRVGESTTKSPPVAALANEHVVRIAVKMDQ